MDLQKEIDSLKVKSGYSGKPQQWQFGFDLACRELAKAHESKKLEGYVLVPHGVLDLTRFMCKTWSEIDKFVYKNCSDIGQYPVIQGTKNQLNLSRIGEQQINANEINKGVNWLLEAAQEPAND
ncbi:hypothetical protein [Acinetobacter towneri]|uniref:hypothetical protein n=1 Tax=Acinetobacter towneri TaxID=202956 RepID=UPI00209811B7|nr:hypothetical protein [Acinetobacter towneri]MCO8058101.1 hypothetical protein [Acinetobacter towneri]MCO8063747.1 hypothetical protein [Acinetobacter towneri]